MLSKNFVTINQLNIDFCTGFQCASHWENTPRGVCRTIGRL